MGFSVHGAEWVHSMFYENSNNSPDGFEGPRAALRSTDTRLTQSVSSY